jgi:hypothetical protein
MSTSKRCAAAPIPSPSPSHHRDSPSPFASAPREPIPHSTPTYLPSSAWAQHHRDAQHTAAAAPFAPPPRKLVALCPITARNHTPPPPTCFPPFCAGTTPS